MSWLFYLTGLFVLGVPASTFAEGALDGVSGANIIGAAIFFVIGFLISKPEARLNKECEQAAPDSYRGPSGNGFKWFVGIVLVVFVIWAFA